LLIREGGGRKGGTRLSRSFPSPFPSPITRRREAGNRHAREGKGRRDPSRSPREIRNVPRQQRKEGLNGRQKKKIHLYHPTKERGGKGMCFRRAKEGRKGGACSFIPEYWHRRKRFKESIKRIVRKKKSTVSYVISPPSGAGEKKA